MNGNGPFFHVCCIDLQPGCCIRAGNYGRELNRVGPSHKSWHREEILEDVRRRQFSDKPSRLNCTYVLETIETAQFYRDKNDPGAGIYTAEPVFAGAATHRTDFNVVEPLLGRPESMGEIAVLYWAAGLWVTVAEHPDLQCVEILFASPLRLLQRVG